MKSDLKPKAPGDASGEPAQAVPVEPVQKFFALCAMISQRISRRREIEKHLGGDEYPFKNWVFFFDPDFVPDVAELSGLSLSTGEKGISAAAAQSIVISLVRDFFGGDENGIMTGVFGGLFGHYPPQHRDDIDLFADTLGGCKEDISACFRLLVPQIKSVMHTAAKAAFKACHIPDRDTRRKLFEAIENMYAGEDFDKDILKRIPEYVPFERLFTGWTLNGDGTGGDGTGRAAPVEPSTGGTVARRDSGKGINDISFNEHYYINTDAGERVKIDSYVKGEQRLELRFQRLVNSRDGTCNFKNVGEQELVTGAQCVFVVWALLNKQGDGASLEELTPQDYKGQSEFKPSKVFRDLLNKTFYANHVKKAKIQGSRKYEYSLVVRK